MAGKNQVEQELAVIASRMRARGHRWTSQRHTIARVALRHHGHVSAEELLELCQHEDELVSRATVYRTLTMLEEAGFVEVLETGDGTRKFEHVIGHEHHDHMVCTICGTIIEFVDARLEARQEAAARQHGFTITHHSLKLFGICRQCRGRNKAGSSRPT